ncbi:MAG: 16S rRNA (cytidine(1402)-2'-O)-methyltransferase [Chlorobi bacterium]|nr:16S rRNA (cytidine(1402)-2'-O)-methyltransferase [Chlorobiota bacterium]
MRKENGTLFVIATPIGNMDDISKRAVDYLSSVDEIYSEDTRVTKKLLNNYGISAKLNSFNARTESRKIEEVINKLLDGKNIGLVSDAGTPGISDPGIRLVNKALTKNIKVSGAPGANAAIFALSVSGFPTDSFVFEGFLPQKKGRQKKLMKLADEERTIVLYESVYRIEKLLNEFVNYMPHRLIAIARELTKMYEEVWRGFPANLLENLSERTLKGEFVVIIAPKNFTLD